MIGRIVAKVARELEHLGNTGADVARQESAYRTEQANPRPPLRILAEQFDFVEARAQQFAEFRLGVFAAMKAVAR